MMKIVLVAAMAAMAAAECPNSCSGHGKCNLYSACDCYRNWMGADCSERVCYFGHAFIDTAQGDINSDGQLSSTSTYTTQYTNEQTWELYDLTSHGKGATAAGSWGYEADAIKALSDGGVNGGVGTKANFAPVLDVFDAAGSSPEKWDEAHFYRECSNKGVCNRQTGQCACFKGYEGEGCTRTACANDCSGHGVCERLKDSDSKYEAWDAYKTQQCVCDAGYMGPDCSLRKCPQGDDPVSRVQDTEVQAWGFTPYGTASAVNTATDAATAAADQSIGARFGIAESFYGRYALKFTDEFGDSWTTSTLNWPSGPFNTNGQCNGTAAVNGGVSHSITAGDKNQRHKTTVDANETTAVGNEAIYCSISTTTEIEDALKALPNDVVPDVSVSFHFQNSGAAATAGANSGWGYKITFSGNSGDVNPLEVLYEVTQCTGTDSCDVNKGTARGYSSQGTTEAPTLESSKVATLVMAGNDGTAAAGTLLSQTTGSSGIVVHGGCRAPAFVTGSAAKCDVHMTSATAFTAAAIAGVKVQGTAVWPFDGNTASARVADVVASIEFAATLTESTGFPFTSTGDAVVKVGTEDVGGTAGTTENTVCSNRGLCDFTTGLCKCFAGYTKGDCSSQNSLAMN